MIPGLVQLCCETAVQPNSTENISFICYYVGRTQNLDPCLNAAAFNGLHNLMKLLLK